MNHSKVKFEGDLVIRKWHSGKIILLWIWGIALILLILRRLESAQNIVTIFLLILGTFAIPLALSVVTWKWLGGKETNKAGDGGE